MTPSKRFRPPPSVVLASFKEGGVGGAVIRTERDLDFKAVLIGSIILLCSWHCCRKFRADNILQKSLYRFAGSSFWLLRHSLQQNQVLALSVLVPTLFQVYDYRY